jgi:hypothetical protein
MPPPFRIVVVDLDKLLHYCLSRQHPRGRHKAAVFHRRLALAARDAPLLRQALLDAADSRRDQLLLTESDAYGQRYRLDFVVTTAAGSATIRSAWIVRTGEDVLRFVTCYVL